ncbi:MAG TPA: molybdopterin molybdotransferase MoeA [Allosphingosinicella sp.]|nr:molybdopterin molybdotransferase MoeA [Allosphingosinicella sp.]
MISFDEAFAIVAAQARPLGAEPVPIFAAYGRILAEPVTALVDSPPADVSAMDGYAVRDAEIAAGRRRFRIAGRSFAGAGFAGSAEAGDCVRIFTGAPLPAGFDRVVIQENVACEGDLASIVEPVSAAGHVRPRGSDFKAGDTLLETGRVVHSRAIVAAAGADRAALIMWRRPRLAVIGTGDELAEPGQARARPGSIPESLSLGIAALAQEWGAETIACHRLPDDLARIAAAAAEALGQADVVVVTGGASVGEKDYAKDAFASCGLELLFSKVAIKPGKPVWFGRARDTLVVGLPGNPTSAMVTGRLLLAPLVAGLGGRDPLDAARWRRAPLAADIEACGDRETFVRARWSADAIEPVVNQDSGAQRALADAELLIRRRACAPALGKGEMVEVIDL